METHDLPVTIRLRQWRTEVCATGHNLWKTSEYTSIHPWLPRSELYSSHEKIGSRIAMYSFVRTVINVTSTVLYTEPMPKIIFSSIPAAYNCPDVSNYIRALMINLSAGWVTRSSSIDRHRVDFALFVADGAKCKFAADRRGVETRNAVRYI
jgi:hypothetical protein